MKASLKRYARVLPALLTPLFLTLSFPDHDQGWLIWIALVPLLMVSAGLRPAASFGVGLIAGLVSFFGIFWWAFHISGFRYFHGIIVAFYLGLYPAFFSAAISFSRRARISLIIVAPLVWVSLDFLRSHVGFLSLPWASLAHSQHGYPVVLQISAITGEYGLTFLIVLVNAVITSVLLGLREHRLQIFTAATVLSVLLFGMYELRSNPPSRPFRVAAVQPCINPGEQDSDPGQAKTLKKLEALTSKASASRPDLIVWPETAVLNLPASPELGKKLENISRTYDVPLLLGASERVKFNNHPLGPSRSGIRSYNAAYLVHAAAGTPQTPYRKNVLVPFGEYLPFGDTLRWPSWFVSEGFETVAGNELTIFTLKNGTKLGVLICWENLFSELARNEVRAGADLLVNMSNDIWSGNTSAPGQHNSASVLRAVENAVPVIVASNAGPSRIIDPKGRTIKASGILVRDAISGDVPLRHKTTVYTRFGDYFAWACILVLFLIFICSALHSIHLKNKKRE